jgi:hypothetical protein
MVLFLVDWRNNQKINVLYSNTVGLKNGSDNYAEVLFEINRSVAHGGNYVSEEKCG